MKKLVKAYRQGQEQSKTDSEVVNDTEPGPVAVGDTFEVDGVELEVVGEANGMYHLRPMEQDIYLNADQIAACKRTRT